MHCLMLLSSRRWVCVLSGSVHGRIGELMLSKGATPLRCPSLEKVRQMTHQARLCELTVTAVIA
jgi:hypothetical protein